MKKTVSILFILSVFTMACNPTASRKPSDAIVSAFKKMHPTATILKWNDEPPIWEAKYEQGSEHGAVSFNDKAEVTETELVIPETQLPTLNSIPEYMKAHYPTEKMQRCELITKQDGTINYEIQITGKEIVFDRQGKYLSEEPD